MQSYINLLKSLLSSSFKIHFNAVPSTPRSSKWHLPLRFPHQHSLCISRLHQGDTCNLIQAVCFLQIMRFLQRHRKLSRCPFEGVMYSTAGKCPKPVTRTSPTLYAWHEMYKPRNKLLNCAVKISSDTPSGGQWETNSCLGVAHFLLF